MFGVGLPKFEFGSPKRRGQMFVVSSSSHFSSKVE